MTTAPDNPIWLPPGTSAATALAALPVAVAAWFRHRFGVPTPIQCLAWPALAEDGHLLISAPTGTGKTLAAFLPLLGPLLANTSPWAVGSGVRGLYVSPLKALGNDAACNLTDHLADLSAYLPAGTTLPTVSVRTGDTSAAERRAFAECPPDLLLTTPESLAVLLSQPRLQDHFAGLRWVVVDEVHALAGSKRGADLALSLERLDRLAGRASRVSGGSVQRVGVSATATPLDEAARYLAGIGRRCRIAVVSDPTPLELTIAPVGGNGTSGFVAELVERIAPLAQSQRSTLVFSNTRGLAERLSWALRRHLPDWDQQVAVHHSSLAASRRRTVEADFKAGRLRVVVSSTSLELGIDIGPVDLVVLVHPPGDVVRLLQRLGRSGHGPGRSRRGLVLTASPAELLEAAVTASSGQAAQCEPLRIGHGPLDVLCQQILGAAAAGSWSADDLFALVCQAYPYRDLSRRDFDDCLAYLLGQDRDGRDWLPARLRGSAAALTIRNAGTARLLRRNLGTILSEEPVAVLARREGEAPAEPETPARQEPRPPASPYRPEQVGHVDQLFAERLQPGDRFLLDGRCLEFRRRGDEGLMVEEVLGRPMVPRWGGDGWPLSATLAQRLYLLRMQAAEALRDGPAALAEMLRRDMGLDDSGATLLTGFFGRQECLSEIPEIDTLLIEVVSRDHGDEYHLHTPLNRLANDALVRVVIHRLARDHGRTALPIVADLGFALLVRGAPLASRERQRPEGPADLFRTLLDARGFDADLDAALAASSAWRERFQKVALTGLMLLRNPVGRKRRVGGPDWGERRLFDQVFAHDPDFVLLRQALREVRSDWCDAATARAYAERLPGLTVRCRFLSQVSPFAENWTQAAVGESEPVETPAEALRRLHAELVGEGTQP